MNPRAALAAAVAVVVVLTVSLAVGLTFNGSDLTVPGVALAAPGSAPEPTSEPTSFSQN